MLGKIQALLHRARPRRAKQPEQKPPETDPEIDLYFEEEICYSNLSEDEYM